LILLLRIFGNKSSQAFNKQDCTRNQKHQGSYQQSDFNQEKHC
jgi:hypothetical protein